MKIAGREVEVVTYPHHGGFVSIAYLPDRQVAGWPCDTRLEAEMDVAKKVREIIAPVPKYDPNRRYESRAADLVARLLEAGVIRVCSQCMVGKPRQPGMSDGYCRPHYIQLLTQMYAQSGMDEAQARQKAEAKASTMPDSSFVPSGGGV